MCRLVEVAPAGKQQWRISSLDATWPLPLTSHFSIWRQSSSVAGHAPRLALVNRLAFRPAGFRHPERRTVAVCDVIFVLLTLAVFAVLGLVVRAVEKL